MVRLNSRSRIVKCASRTRKHQQRYPFIPGMARPALDSAKCRQRGIVQSRNVLRDSGRLFKVVRSESDEINNLFSQHGCLELWLVITELIVQAENLRYL